ncbi:MULTISPECIES: sensor histidine kinase [unclassified Nocardiopsis]|uniref:sensor histidine kinase n=1 Tax=Nocardiopsis TaxID=2013 RepID=UPI00387AA3F3
MTALPRPTRTDVWIALSLFVLSAGSTLTIQLVDPRPDVTDPWPWGYAVIAAAALPLLWRTAFPQPVALVSVTAATVYYPLGFPDGVVMACTAVMLYTLVRWGYRTFGWTLGAVQFAALNGYELVFSGAFRAEALGIIGWVLVLLCAGEVMRWRSEYQKADRERRAEADRTREEELLRRASEERLRLARDVHDTVAHNISLINVQAGTALYLMENEPERASQALATIKQTSKDTLVELRAILGVLRAADEGAPRSPVAGVDRIDEVAEAARGAGIAVEVKVTGTPVRLPVGTDSAAYRTVQEALTNVVRHAEADRATVLVDYLPDAVVVEVADDGRGTLGVPAAGNGITGMRERAALVGGTVDAGPREGGGFRVRARLPIAGSDESRVPANERGER